MKRTDTIWYLSFFVGFGSTNYRTERHCAS
jgi:hypothetical protein